MGWGMVPLDDWREGMVTTYEWTWDRDGTVKRCGRVTGIEQTLIAVCWTRQLRRF